MARIVNGIAGSGEVGDGGAGPVLGGEHRAGLGQEAGAGRGEPHMPRRAVEQLGAQVAFEPPHLLADGGLHDVQALGGPPEVQFLGDRHEVPQLAQFHAGMVRRRIRTEPGAAGAGGPVGPGGGPAQARRIAASAGA